MNCGCSSDSDADTHATTPSGGAGGGGSSGSGAAGGGQGGKAAGGGGAGAAGKAGGAAGSSAGAGATGGKAGGSGGSVTAGAGGATGGTGGSGGATGGTGGTGGAAGASGASGASGAAGTSGGGGSGGAAGSGGAGGGGTGGSGGTGQTPSGLELIDISNPADLTSDGHYALLQDFESVNGDVYRYDSLTATTLKLGDAANPDPAKGDTSMGTPLVAQPATRFSADTTRVVGTHGAPLQAAFLTQGKWRDLGGLAGQTGCPGAQGNIDDLGTRSAGWDISGDGKTLVGMSWEGCGGAKAIRWVDDGTPAGVFTTLEFSGKSFNRATRVSADGLTAGGFVDSDMADRTPAIWAANGKITVLDPTGVAIGEVLAMSDDGKVAAGPWNDATGNGAFLWTVAGGVKMLPKLATFQVFDQVFPNAVAANGQLVFGASGDPNGNGSPVQAFVCTTKDGKVQLLEDIVLQHGFTLPPNVHLANVIDASNDGSVLLGTTLDMDPALPFPKQRAFLLRLPVAAYGL